MAFKSNVIIDEPEKRSYNIVVKHIVKWKLSNNKIIYKQYEIGIIPLLKHAQDSLTVQRPIKENDYF